MRIVGFQLLLLLLVAAPMATISAAAGEDNVPARSATASQDANPWGFQLDAAHRSAIYVLVALGVIGLVAVGRWTYLAVANRGPRRTRWDEKLIERGLDASERDFLQQLAKQVALTHPDKILASVHVFEEALEQSKNMRGSDPRRERVVESIRTKLGWNHSPEPRSAVNEELLEPSVAMELFGTGALAGYCARGSLLHRDSSQLVLILEEGAGDIPWKKGDSLQVYFWRENDAGYIFQSEILEVREHGGICHLLLSFPARLERKQKRMFMRAKFEEPLQFQVIPRAEAGTRVSAVAARGAVLDGTTEDISAGGFRFVSRHTLQLGDFISLIGFSPAGCDILAQVVNVLGSVGDGLTRYGAQYSGLSSGVREAITRRVFSAQRESIANNPV